MSKKLPYSTLGGATHLIGLQPVQKSDQKPSEVHVMIVNSGCLSKPLSHEHIASSSYSVPSYAVVFIFLNTRLLT